MTDQTVTCTGITDESLIVEGSVQCWAEEGMTTCRCQLKPSFLTTDLHTRTQAMQYNRRENRSTPKPSHHLRTQALGQITVPKSSASKERETGKPERQADVGSTEVVATDYN